MIGFGCLANNAQAQAVAFQQKFVASGRATRLGWVHKLDPSCRLLPMDSVTVIAPPQFGQVTFKRSSHYPTYPPGNVRARCNDRKVPTTEIFYSAAAGYVGVDAFVVETITSYGAPQHVRYRVIVQ